MAGEIINIGGGQNYIANVRASVSPGGSTAVGVYRAPTEEDDSANTGGIGFAVERGALWQDTRTDTLYYCADATAGAAVWTALESASAATDHNVLANRDSDDQHPISAITGLEDTLDGLDDAIDGKEGALGNPSTDGYVLSSSAAGVRAWVADGGVTDHDALTNRDAEDQHPISAITGLDDALGDKEAALGSPSSDGYVLSSSAEGVRSWVAGGGGGVTDHDDLTNRDAEDQHPISAITGLTAALGDKFCVAGGDIDGDVDIDGYLSVSGGLTTGATGVDTALAYDCAFLDRTSRPWPILAESQRDSATKALGSVCYNDDASRLEIWSGSAWLPVAGSGEGTTDHSDLSNRDAADQHPISAITGLEDTLQPWCSLTPGEDFTTVGTAATYLSIAMLTDNSSMIRPGMLMRAAFDSTMYPFLVLSCTSGELLLAGCAGPFDEEVITTLDYYVHSTPWIRQDIVIPGNWCDTTDTSLLLHDVELENYWRDEPAYLTAFALSSPTISGAPEFAVTIGGTAASDEIGPSAMGAFNVRGVLPAAMAPLILSTSSSDIIELDVTTAVATGNSGLYVTLFFAPQKLVEAL